MHALTTYILITCLAFALLRLPPRNAPTYYSMREIGYVMFTVELYCKIKSLHTMHCSSCWSPQQWRDQCQTAIE